MSVTTRPMCPGVSGFEDSLQFIRLAPSPPVAVVMDGSIAMRGAAAVLVEAGLDDVREYPDVGQWLVSSHDGPEVRSGVVLINLSNAKYIGLLDQIRPLLAAHRILSFCSEAGRPDVTGMLDAGVRGCVTWDAGAAMLVEAVRMVSTLGFYPPPSPVSELPPTIRRGSVMGVGRQPGRASREQMLTLREREVLQSVSTGLTHKEIARQLGLSKTTVDTYVQRIRQKLGVGNKAELVRAAYRFGLCNDE